MWNAYGSFAAIIFSILLFWLKITTFQKVVSLSLPHKCIKPTYLFSLYKNVPILRDRVDLHLMFATLYVLYLYIIMEVVPASEHDSLTKTREKKNQYVCQCSYTHTFNTNL